MKQWGALAIRSSLLAEARGRSKVRSAKGAGMAERRKSRKRNTESSRESKRLSLLDLPPALDPRGDQPTNPVMVIRPERQTTLPPAPAEPLADASLASLAKATRRAPNREAPAKKAPARRPTEPSVPPAFPPTSTLPPPVQVPSDPPQGRARSSGNLLLRTLGVIVLSASVGAGVSSLIWGVKSELLRAAMAGDTKTESARAAATLQGCATATPFPEPTTAPSAAPVAGTGSETARISVDALPLQQARRKGVAVELVSLEDPVSRPVTETRYPERRAASRAETPEHSSRETKRTQVTAAARMVPAQPSRAAINQAIGRAASAATSCDTGPQDGRVTVTFAPSGAVQSVSLVKGFGDAAVNGCVLRAFGRARVPAFSGDPVLVRKSIAW